MCSNITDAQASPCNLLQALCHAAKPFAAVDTPDNANMSMLDILLRIEYDFLRTPSLTEPSRPEEAL
jgi:hypothetical protein